jgi:hypothetical protein
MGLLGEPGDAFPAGRPIVSAPGPPNTFPEVVPPTVPPGGENVSGITDDPFGHLYEQRASEPTSPYDVDLIVSADRGSDRGGFDQPPRGGRKQVPPVPPRRGRRKVIVTVAAVIAVLAAGGGVAAWAVTRHTGHASAQGSHPPRVHATNASSSPAQPSTSAPPTTPAPTSTGLVAVAPGVSQQGNEPAVVAFLNNYFTAINNHDYRLYRSLLDTQLQQGETAAKFRSGFGGSSDSAATLTGPASVGVQTAATVTFTSHQPPADTPTNTSCTLWNITLYLDPQGSSYVIGTPASSYHASYQAC